MRPHRSVTPSPTSPVAAESRAGLLSFKVSALRRRYPDSLVCDCARLIATRGHDGRSYRCASCAIEAPALAKEAAKRFAALSRRGPAPTPEQMRVLAAGDGAHRLESLALMGVLCSHCAGGHPTTDCGYDGAEAAAVWRARAGKDSSPSILAPIRPSNSNGLPDGVSSLAKAASRLRSRGGRPRRHETQALRQRAYRARRSA